MNKRVGSALLIVIFIISGIGSIITVMYYRHSLLMETIIARNKKLKLKYAAQACMFYAIELAKANWYYLSKQQDTIHCRDLCWHVSINNSCKAYIGFTAKQKNLEIVVILYNEKNGIEQKIKSIIAPIEIDKTKGKLVKLIDWIEN